MTSSTEISVPRRLLCVDIPPSPLHRSARVSLPHWPSSSELKENTRPVHAETDGTPQKRKLSAIDTTEPTIEPAMPIPKKQKLVNTTGAVVNVDYTYCHQCNKKRDIDNTIQCTWKDKQDNAKNKDHRCTARFCQPCLRNRYGEDAVAIRSAGPAQARDGHVDESYTFKCPRCRDICNCVRCRRKKGLSPTGNLTVIAKKSGSGSVAQALIENPNATGILPGKGQQVEAVPKPKKVVVPKDAVAEVKTEAKRKTSAPKPKVLPTVKWTRLRTGLSVEEAESRFQIREFILRFAPIMANTISKAHLEELANIGGPSRSDLDEDEMVAWVSETCTKSIIMGLLGLLADDEEDKQIAKTMKVALKEIRSSGANLNKMWAALAETRDGSSSSPPLDFPDPLPPPTATASRSTRSMRANSNAASTIHIAVSAQLIPIISHFVEAAIATQAVRTELEEGVKEGKETSKEAREALRKESERWDADKKDIEAAKQGTDPAQSNEIYKLKQLRVTHKQNVQDIENSLKVAMSCFIPRFSPLGMDHDGRTYWALSPGIHDRDDALAFVSRAAEAGLSTKKSKGKKKITKNEDERRSFKDWSWFVAVWGKKPPAATTPSPSNKERKTDESEDESEEDSDDDEEVDKWWAFWKPSEIANIADWIAIKCGLEKEAGDSESEPSRLSDDDSPREHISNGDEDAIMATADQPSREALKELIRSLKEYASVLEWRTRVNED